MRAWALAALLLIPVVQAIEPGPAQTLSDYPVQLAAPARGDGFTAWIDVRAGKPNVLLHWDGKGTTVRLLDAPATALQHLVADGHWLAWSQQATAGLLPGEQAPRVNWDLIVYDLDRGAVVFDSSSARGNETDPRLDGGRIAYLDDASGVQQAMLASLSGGSAFQGKPVLASGRRHGPPALDGKTVVFTQAAPAGLELLSVTDGQAMTLVPAQAGQGLGVPAAWDGRVAWPQNLGSTSWLNLLHDGTTQTWNWTDGTVMAVAGDGALVVAEVRTTQRALYAWCGEDAPTKLTGGIQSRPAVADGRVASLVQVGTEQHVQDRDLSCGGAGGSAGKSGAPGLALTWLALALLACGLVARRLRS